MAVPLIWQQMPDRIGLIALARQALGEPEDAREAASSSCSHSPSARGRSSWSTATAARS